MKYVDRSTVLAAIDATGHTQKGVAIQYVNMKGQIKRMEIQKVFKNGSPNQNPNAKGNYRIREKGLIRVNELKSGQDRSLYIFQIIGFQPNLSEAGFYRVTHE